MSTRPGSASDFVLQTLRAFPDRELRQSDLLALADGRFKPDNIRMCLKILLAQHRVVRNRDGAESWWAIAR